MCNDDHVATVFSRCSGSLLEGDIGSDIFLDKAVSIRNFIKLVECHATCSLHNSIFIVLLEVATVNQSSISFFTIGECIIEDF